MNKLWICLISEHRQQQLSRNHVYDTSIRYFLPFFNFGHKSHKGKAFPCWNRKEWGKEWCQRLQRLQLQFAIANCNEQVQQTGNCKKRKRKRRLQQGILLSGIGIVKTFAKEYPVFQFISDFSIRGITPFEGTIPVLEILKSISSVRCFSHQSAMCNLHLTQGTCCCDLPTDGGPCEAGMERWGFQGEGCAKFAYGGCPGNCNVFASKRECENLCQGRKVLKNIHIYDDSKLLAFARSFT